MDVSLSEHQAVTAAFIQNALYLKVKSSYEKSNVLLKYLSEWSTFRYIFLGNESRISGEM